MKQNVLSNRGITRRHFVTTSTIALTGVLYGTKQATAARQAAASAGPPDPKLIEDLVAANRILADLGIVDAYGHVSARHNRDPNRYLLSRDLAPALVTADDIMEYDLDSNPVDAKGRSLYRERFIHGEIYKARPDVMAVVHDHSPTVIPFSVSTVPLRPVFHAAAFVIEGVPVFDTRRVPGPPHMLVASREAGRALAETLGSKPAALIRGHGAVLVGASLPMVVGRSVYLEMNAKLQAQAMALGGNVTYLAPEEARELATSDYQRAWELWKRKVMMK